MATLLAKLMIKKGADLHCRNQHDVGLLHLAVQTNNMLAFKFALAHNKQVRAKRKSKPMQRGLMRDGPDPALFDFNGRGGKHQGTVLHHAIFHTNLAMITFILQSGEYVDLTALDANGKRAIDLCPYSSPIFKSIRDKTKRKVRDQALYAHERSDALPMSD